MTPSYEEFLASKSWSVAPSGFEVDALDPSLFPFQRDLVQWALRQGRCALFADTGMGKSAMQLEWARHVSKRAGDVLILAPLAVAAQTVREGQRIGVDVTLCRDAADLRPGINITNYDRLHRFDCSRFAGVVLDESSIIKHHDSKTLKTLLDAFRATPYKLCATATPSPNDFSELGTHAEFLGICTQPEMLSEFFINDAGDTGTWRLKGHAKKVFWQWVASWGALIRKPSDLGYDDAGYALPALEVVHHTVAVEKSVLLEMGVLFARQARDLTERRNARKASVNARAQMVADTVRDSWTRNRNVNTTGGIGSQISTDSWSNERSGTPKTQIKNENTPEDIRPHYPKKRSANMIGDTAQSTPRSGAHTVASDTRESATILSPTTRSAGRNDQRSSETGISEPNTESLSSNTTLCSPVSSADAEYVAVSPGDDGSRSTMTTRREMSEDSYATVAITDSADLKTTCTGFREQWIIWCDLNAEAELVAKLIPGSVNVTGSDTAERKEQAVLDFIEGRIRCLISKPSIFGYGLNLQCCARMAYVGVTDSYESYYQSLRRIYRFGQKRPIVVHVFASEAEGSVVDNLKRKERDAMLMADELSRETREIVRANIRKESRRRDAFEPNQKMKIPAWMEVR